MALLVSGQRVELREVQLRELPEELLQLSRKATVPVMLGVGGEVIEESLEVMLWSLRQADPQGWLQQQEQACDWIRRNDNEFKPLLDCYKYADRHPQFSQLEHRQRALPFVEQLEQRLQRQPFLVSSRFGLADAAILPFLRQFAGVEPEWFRRSGYVALRAWLASVLESEFFARVMQKYPTWKPGDPALFFPAQA